MQPPIDAASFLREHGVQVTAQRLAVLRAVSGRPHGTAEDVAEVVYWGRCPECLAAAPVSAGD